MLSERSLPGKEAVKVRGSHRIRTLIVHPLDVSYSSYQYINALTARLMEHDVETTILAPHQPATRLAGGGDPSFNIINMVFEKGMLSRDTKREINRFDPDIVHAWNSREMIARAALETVIGTGAKLIVNYEDPEYFHFDTLMGAFKSSSVLRHVDKAFVTAQDVESFVKEMNWHVLWKGLEHNPHSGQFLNPMFFAILNHLASGFTGIWHPWVNLLQERFRKPTLLMPYSVDFSTRPLPIRGDTRVIRAKLKIPDGATVFLRTGMIYAIVNDQETLYAAFAAVLKQRTNSVLVLCGSDGDPALTTSLIEKYGIAAAVRRPGFLSETEYNALLDAGDIFLCPGYPDDYNRYRFAMKIIEYLVLGKPMICYAAGIGESLVHGRDALLLDEYTPQRFCELMIRLSDDPGLRNTLGRNARARAEEWLDVRTLAPQVAEFYRGLLQKQLKPLPAPTTVHDPDALPRALLWKLPQLLASGTKVVALYGAGKHTQRLLKWTHLEPLRIACIVDDRLGPLQLDGIEIVSPEKISDYHFDTLLVSSDSQEERMAKRAAGWLPGGIRIERLYGNSNSP